METEKKVEQAEQDMRYEGGGSAPAGGSAATSGAGPQLLDELRRLGTTVAQAVSAALSSEQSVRLQKDLRTGLDNVANSVDSSIKSLAENPQTKEIVADTKVVAGQVSDTIKSSKLANDLAVALAAALHTLNDELHKMATEMKANAPTQDAPADASTTPEPEAPHDIPISRE